MYKPGNTSAERQGKVEILILVFLVMLLAGCRKDDGAAQRQDEYLVDVTGRFSYEDADDYLEFISSSVPYVESESIKNLFFGVAFFREIADMSRKIYSEQKSRGWKMERINFTYNSTSATGEPIVLSGAVMFPNSTRPGVVHELDGVTLYNPYWLGKFKTVTDAGTAVMIRSSYNQLVVASDYQGYGVTQGKYHNPFLEYFTLARQSIDCELAALELMDRMGIRLKDGYKTYNMGMSKGAPIAMAIQKMIENSEPENVRRLVNLGSTYCCSGPYDTEGLFLEKMGRKDDDNLWMIPFMVLSSYYSHPEVFGGFSIEEFFTESFVSARMVAGGEEMGLIDVLEEYKADEAEMEEAYRNLGIDSADKILSPRFFKENGELDKEDRLVSLLLGVLSRNCTSRGWAPKTPILIEYGEADDFVSYEISRDSCEELKAASDREGNRCVEANAYAGLDHTVMSTVGLFRMMMEENPTDRWILP